MMQTIVEIGGFFADEAVNKYHIADKIVTDISEII